MFVVPISLAGWRRVPIDGGVRLIPPDPAPGIVQVRHGLALRPLREIVAQLIELKLGGEPVELVAPPRMIATAEGEYGAVFELVGAHARRAIGVVFGDDSLAMVDGRVVDATRFADFAELVEQLTMGISLGLGTDRWRRFWYQPPSGWGGFSRVRADVWLAPGYPSRYGIITVFHARPETATPTLLQHHKLFEELTSEYGGRRTEPTAVQTKSGMLGQAVGYEGHVDGITRNAGNAVFSDGRYMYLMRVESDEAYRDEHTAAFFRMVETVEAIPWPRQNLAGFVHWSE